LHQHRSPHLIVVEEPEVAIHLGALRTLVEIIREHADESRILVTTHSADIIDALDVEELRVVWSEDGISYVAPLAEHTRETVRAGLITPGELLRSDALDPVVK
jgi:predicted ATPase